MDKFLEVTGMLIVALTLLISVIVLASARSASALVFVAPWAIPSVIGGVVLAAFGSMLEQLKAIRSAIEHQTYITKPTENQAGSAGSLPVSSARMIRCDDCGNAVRADANVCSYCGFRHMR